MRANYNKENLIEIVKNSYSISDVARSLGLKPMGSNFNTIRKYIDLYNIDISHFTGQTWNKGINYLEKTARVPLSEILKENTNFQSDQLKKRLIAEGIKEYKCEKCGITEWCNEPITLELHHINGNHYDNRLENLQILCPNCHSQSHNWKGKNQKKYIDKPSNFKQEYNKVCPICGKEFKADRNNRVYCSSECYNNELEKNKKTKNFNESELKYAMTLYNDIESLSKHFNLSRTTIRKRLNEFGLLEEFKSKYNFKAKPILQYDIHGNFIKEWPSINDAEETLKIFSIGKCANLQRKSAGGYVWRYKNNGEEN